MIRRENPHLRGFVSDAVARKLQREGADLFRLEVGPSCCIGRRPRRPPSRRRTRPRCYHSVFSVSQAKKFDLGMYAPGKRSKNVTFDHAGQVDLFCSLNVPRWPDTCSCSRTGSSSSPTRRGTSNFPGCRLATTRSRRARPRFGSVSSKIDVERGRTATTHAQVPPSPLAERGGKRRHAPFVTHAAPEPVRSLPPHRSGETPTRATGRLIDRRRPERGRAERRHPLGPPGDSE